MKKIISIFVVVMMVVSLFSVSAGAIDIDDRSENGTLEGAEKDDFGGSTSAEVKIEIDNDLIHRYAVDIIFETVIFTPNSGAIWDANNHEYYHADSVTWLGTGNVTIKNHSDMAITYEAEAEVTATQYGVDIVFNGETTYAPIEATTINGCSIGATADTVPAAAFTYGVVGVPKVAQIGVTTLGKIKVTVAPVD